MAAVPKLNVLFILRPARDAGADMVLLEAAARLDRNRFRVVYGLLTREPGQAEIIPPDAEIIDFNLPNLTGVIWLKFFLQLLGLLRQKKIHLIHANSYIPGNYVRLAAIFMGVPVIIDHWHGFTHFNRKRKMICRFLGRHTDLSLTVSQGVRDYVLSQCRLDPARVRVVPNGVDYARFQQPRPGRLVRQELGLPKEVPVVGLVARLEHWGKGHKELFTAMALLKEPRPCHALIVGGGRRQGEMQQLADRLGLSELVHFLGHREDIPDLLGAMDIFVLPSHSEGVSLALLEAMAAGLPVIVSNVGGLPEVVQHQENGLVIPVKDPQALAQALEKLLADPTYAQSLGEAARREVKAHYSLERLGRDINEIYEELAQKKFGGGGQGPQAHLQSSPKPPPPIP